MPDGGPDAAEDALPVRSCVEKMADDRLGDRFFAAYFNSAGAVRALDSETTEVVAGDEWPSAGSAVEDKVHADF